MQSSCEEPKLEDMVGQDAAELTWRPALPNCSLFLPVAAAAHPVFLKWDLFCLFLVMPRGSWNLCFPTRDHTQDRGGESAESNHWATREFPKRVIFLSLNKHMLGRWSSNSLNMISIMAAMKRAP